MKIIEMEEFDLLRANRFYLVLILAFQLLNSVVVIALLAQYTTKFDLLPVLIIAFMFYFLTLSYIYREKHVIMKWREKYQKYKAEMEK